MIAGYFVYGAIVEKVFKPDPDRTTPALANNDGVDYVPLDWKKIFLIQLLNIAGLGPIFGAISGALWGPVAFLWIVFGCIFAGAVHDYFSGMLSVRNNGASISEITGKYLGPTMKNVMRVFSVILLVLVGTVFMTGPAQLLAKLTPNPVDEFLAGCGSSILLFSHYLTDRQDHRPTLSDLWHCPDYYGSRYYWWDLGARI